MPGIIETSREETASQASYAVDLRPGKVINLPANLKRQFYPPLMLLQALSRPTVLKRRGPDDTSRGNEYDPEQIFLQFVNRLALICQVEPNGDAVSSCVVTQEPDKVVYVFASNHRSDAQLVDVAKAFRGILEMVPQLDESTDEDDSEIRGKMLRKVLALSWCRIRRYLKSLRKELGSCIESCQRSENQRDRKLGLALDGIVSLVYLAAEAAETAKSSEDRTPFTRATEVVINELEKLQKDSYLFSLIRRRVARENKLASGTYWTEMCHISDRLKAYKSVIDTIFVARDNWPELFDGFEVRFVPSPNRIANPLPSEPKTSAQLIQVSTSDRNLLPKLKQDLEGLQRNHNIDELIAVEWRNGLKPTVHAEVQIFNWLESSGGTRFERFFGGYKFIGSSKPTCKLCSYYFENRTDVKIRPSHKNLYTHWRVPDLYDYELGGEDRRKDVVHKIKKLVVADIDRTIREKLADGRNHDSTDQRGRDTASIDTLSSIMDNLSVVGEADDTLYSKTDNLGAVDEVDEVDEVSDSIETVTFQGRRGPVEPRRP